MIIGESPSEPYIHVCPRKRRLTLKWLAIMELSFVKKQSCSHQVLFRKQSLTATILTLSGLVFRMLNVYIVFGLEV